MARKTKLEAQVTRERLLDAAETVFRQRGVTRTSLAEVAGAAGGSRLLESNSPGHLEDR
jgi:TetR/AcrR family transcriptional regulator, acrAB operon repressor